MYALISSMILIKTHYVIGMIMASEDGSIKKAAKRTAAIVPRMLGFSWLTYNAQYIRDLFKFTFSSAALKDQPTQAPAEDFTVAMQRLNLSEADLTTRMKQLRFATAIFTIFGIGVWIYAGIHITNGAYHSGLLASAIGFFAFAQAFNYHFWLFQIKHRKLGCTLGDWFKGTFLGSMKP